MIINADQVTLITKKTINDSSAHWTYCQRKNDHLILQRLSTF